MASVKDGIETRERLLRAAANLYSAKGFAGASVLDVARRAGVTKGAFYHHFESKAHLIMAIHNSYVDVQIGDITAIVEKGLAPTETLAEAIIVIFRNMIDHKASVSLFVREFPAFPKDVDRAVRARRLEYERLGDVRVGDAVVRPEACPGPRGDRPQLRPHGHQWPDRSHHRLSPADRQRPI